MQEIAEKIKNLIPQLDLQLPGCRDLSPGNGEDDHANLRIHSHRHREILMVLKGSGNYQVDSRWYKLQPGSVIFIDSWQMHSCYAYKALRSDLEHIWFMLYPRRVVVTGSELSGNGTQYRNRVLGPLAEPAARLLTGVWERLRMAPPEERMRHVEQLQMVMRVVSGEIVEYLFNSNVRTGAKAQEMADFLADYIENRYGCGCTLSNLEKLTGYSSCYISHLFHRKFGKTVGEAVNEARMRYVIEQIRHGAATKAIAAELEFASPESFWKWRRNNRQLETQLLQNLKDDTEE